ncbi:MAG TPA: MFS transporter [Abditibacteriaceae bacterium]|jgi:PPP family 3-phenylpropionic acid transporter
MKVFEPAVADRAQFGISLWQHWALLACMFLTTGAGGFVQPFVSLYLEAAGLKQGQIGLVLGCSMATALIIQPLLGHLSDRIDARRPLMFAAGVLSAVAYSCYNSAQGIIVFTLLTMLAVNGFQYLNAGGAVVVARMAHGPGQSGAAQTGTAYASYRVWGSVGFIVVTLLCGAFMHSRFSGVSQFGRAELQGIFKFGPLLFLGAGLASCLLPDRKTSLEEKRVLEKSRESLPVNLRWFLAAIFCYMFSVSGAFSYLSLYMKSLGAMPLTITCTWAAGVVCEVLMMMRIGRLTDRFGRRPALIVAFLALPVRMLLYIPAPSPLWILMVQLMEGLGFGIMGATIIAFVNDSAHDARRGIAQARLSAVSGLALALGPVIGGVLVQRLGMSWLFAAMAGVGAVGAVIVLTRVRESHPMPEPLQHRHAALQPALRLLAEPPHA